MQINLDKETTSEDRIFQIDYSGVVGFFSDRKHYQIPFDSGNNKDKFFPYKFGGYPFIFPKENLVIKCLTYCNYLFV